MRKTIIAGNWKMNLSPREGSELVSGLKSAYTPKTNLEVVICPQNAMVSQAAKWVFDSTIKIGAQNCSDKLSGAYTGETSPELLRNLGCTYCIVGHSERREYNNESNEFVAAKAALLAQLSIKPIVCCGETLQEREAGSHYDKVKAQVFAAYDAVAVENWADVVIAYEPIWAIGTGVTATSEQAQEMHQFIRAEVAKKTNAQTAMSVSILYGGSAKPGNAAELLGQADIDGLLVGGASMQVTDFSQIIESFAG